MKYFIITGTSRGIGEAIARKLLMTGNSLICTSRSLNEDLTETASNMSIPLYYHPCDLSRTSSAMEFIKTAFRIIDLKNAESIALINNAGMLAPIGPAGNLKPLDIERHYKTNILAPVNLTNEFIKRTQTLTLQKVILNISSGASGHPYHGWSVYCSSKAALEMFTRTVALEQETEKHPVIVFALKPGIVDTSMQSLIRRSDPELFRDRDKFVKLHDNGLLVKPETVADAIVSAMLSGNIPQGGILTLDDLIRISSL
ncbi:MAG TPA: (S)-benzoin forming benzil reductase [Bacteroidales bacterium]|nr:(S)-benzoin forming benzil reductase [Bacteroidales bacterium]